METKIGVKEGYFFVRMKYNKSDLSTGQNIQLPLKLKVINLSSDLVLHPSFSSY